MLVKPHEKGAEPGPAPQAVTAVPTSALAFTGIPPCRLADTRGNGFTGQYGPPQIAAATGRTMTITGQCGIPGNAEAVSFNFSAVNVPGPGFLVAYPAGGAFPPVATLVYNQNTPNLSNAAVVPLGTGGAITVVAGVVPVDLVIDVNGYYGPQGGPGGLLPTGTSGQTLRHNGTSWVANSALTSDGTNLQVGSGGSITFPGNIVINKSSVAALKITLGSVFLGQATGVGNPTGDYNTGIGAGALNGLTGANSSENTAVGTSALGSNTSTYWNTAIGTFALSNHTSGVANTAVGNRAGYNSITGSNNLYLGNEGVSDESNTIRLGSGLQHTRLFVAAVLGTSIGSSSPMFINGSGQVGTVVSSARFKEEIHDMGDASERLLELRPVTFRYKGHPEDPTQFGLIAEEVERVLPELVLHDSTGQPESVLYHEMPAMLLNELQKQQRRIERLDAENARLRKRLESLEERLSGSATK